MSAAGAALRDETAISHAVAQSLDAARAHPLAQFGLDALVAGAARPRPGALAFVDCHDGVETRIVHADLYSRIGASLARLRGFDLAAGDCVLISAPPGAQAFVALVAALAAGLEPVLAPLPLPAMRPLLSLAARDVKAAAIFAPAQFCGVDFEEALLTLAAETASIRFIGALSGVLDGAADFTPAMLEAPVAPRARLSDAWSTADLPQVGALNEMGGVDFVSQGALLAAALDYVRITRKHGDAPILSLCAPASLPALVAGPLAALIAGSPLYFLAPFEAARFLATLDTLGRVRLVTPATLLPDLAKAGLLTGDALLSVAALSHGGAPRIDVAATCPIVNIGMQKGHVTLS